jgi:hypothetical protein
VIDAGSAASIYVVDPRGPSRCPRRRLNHAFCNSHRKRSFLSECLNPKPDREEPSPSAVNTIIHKSCTLDRNPGASSPSPPLYNTLSRRCHRFSLFAIAPVPGKDGPAHNPLPASLDRSGSAFIGSSDHRATCQGLFSQRTHLSKEEFLQSPPLLATTNRITSIHLPAFLTFRRGGICNADIEVEGSSRR